MPKPLQELRQSSDLPIADPWEAEHQPTFDRKQRDQVVAERVRGQSGNIPVRNQVSRLRSSFLYRQTSAQCAMHVSKLHRLNEEVASSDRVLHQSTKRKQSECRGSYSHRCHATRRQDWLHPMPYIRELRMYREFRQMENWKRLAPLE